jgi:hypothetical protein
MESNVRLKRAMNTKSNLPLLAIFLGLITAVQATPDRIQDVDEQFLASNEQGFVILRTVYDNLGSNYSGKTTTYLDEYEKKVGSGEEIVMSGIARKRKSTTLLDIRTSVDPDSPRNKPLITETVMEKAEGFDLASLLTKYQQRGTLWSKEDFAKLMSWKTERGDLFSAAKCFLMSDHVTSLVFQVERRTEYSINEVREDGNCLYLRLTTGGEDEGRQTRWICLLPDETRQVRAHLRLEPHYLTLARFKTLDEAKQKAQDIVRSAKDDKAIRQYVHQLEIWSSNESSSSDRPYFIVLSSGAEWMSPSKFEKMKAIFGPDLAPTTSLRFNEYFPVEHEP